MGYADSLGACCMDVRHVQGELFRRHLLRDLRSCLECSLLVLNIREVAPVLLMVPRELVFAGVAQSALLTRRLGGRPCLGRYWLGLGRRLLNRSFGPLARARRFGGRRAGGRLRPTAWSRGNVLLLILLALRVVLPLLQQPRRALDAGRA